MKKIHLLLFILLSSSCSHLKNCQITLWDKKERTDYVRMTYPRIEKSEVEIIERTGRIVRLKVKKPQDSVYYIGSGLILKKKEHIYWSTFDLETFKEHHNLVKLTRIIPIDTWIKYRGTSPLDSEKYSSVSEMIIEL